MVYYVKNVILIDDKGVKVKAEPENEDRPIILKKKLQQSVSVNKKVAPKKVKEETLPAVCNFLKMCLFYFCFSAILDSKPFGKRIRVPAV